MREILTDLNSSEDEPSEFGLTVTVFLSLRYFSLQTLNNGRRNPKPKISLLLLPPPFLIPSFQL